MHTGTDEHRAWAGGARWRRVLPHLATLAACLFLSLVASYPLVGQLTDHLANRAESHDAAGFAWNNWWIEHALVALRHKPYFTEHVMVPAHLDLRLHTLGLFYGLVSVPFLRALGPLAVVNLQIILTPVLNGYCTFLLVRRWIGRADVAVLCGIALAASPVVDFHLGMGRPSCAALWPGALCLLFLMRLVEERRWRDALGLAGSLVVLLSTDQQMPLFAGWILFLYLASVLITHRASLLDRTFLTRALVVMALIAYPVRVLYVRPFFQTPGYTTPHPSEAFRYSAPLAHVVSPAGLWRGYGVVLVAGLLGALLLVRRDRRAAFAAFAAISSLAFVVGPGVRFPTPFDALRHLPALSQFRAPYRFQIAAGLGMTLALAVGVRWLLEHVRGRASAGRLLLAALGILIAGDGLAHRVVGGFPTHAVVHEPIYRRIGETPGDFLLLEVPVGVRTGSDEIGRGDDLMIHQVVHGKRMINAFIARVPLDVLAFYRRSPALLFLANEPYDAGAVAADFEAKLRQLDVGFILVHPSMLDRDRADAILVMLRGRPDLEAVSTGTDTVAFRVRDRTSTVPSAAAPARKNLPL
jgi:hypothetical protein